MARITFLDTEIDDICAYRSTLTYLDDEKLSLITFFLIVNSSRKYWSIKLEMHCGLIELLTKLLLECPHTGLYLGSLVISLLNLNINLCGLSGN